MAAFPTCLTASAIPAAATLTHVLEVPVGMAYGTFQITALNDGVATATIKIAVAETALVGAVVRADYIEVREEVEPGGLYSRFGILVKGGEHVFVQSTTADVIFRVVGLAHEVAV